MAEGKKLNLMLHCGGFKVGRGDVERVRTPEGTRTWVPIPHHELLELVERTLDFDGFEVDARADALARNGDRYFGLMQVRKPAEKSNEDAGLVVGIRNSHDKSFPAGLVLGEAPFVCDNLCFSGEVKLSRKHTTNIRRDLPNVVERAMGKLLDMRYTQEKRVMAYKEAPVLDRDAHHLLIQAMDARVIANAKIPKVLKEWRSPSHEEFGEKNVWRLYNAFTEVMKDTNVFSKPRCSDALHGVLDSYSGLKAVA